ncbi:membrane hypothetical protein [Rhodospirillaceae bacterium LM-1]|nr:membrane hypothetical protein [Rhodospirillaceae bacterium LM-1]
MRHPAPSDPAQEEIDYRLSVKYDVPSLLLAILVFSSVLVFFLNRNESGPFERFFIIPVLALMLLTTLINVFDRRPVLIFDQSGLFFRPFMDRPLPWADIEWIRGDYFTFLDERFHIHLRESAPRIHGLFKRWKFFLLFQGRMNSFTITTFGLAIWGKELKRRLQASPAGAKYSVL